MAFRQLGNWQVYDDAGRRKYLSEAERKSFLVAADRLPDAADRLLCRTLVFTGCRISEALALRAEHLDTNRLSLTVKTLKQRRARFRLVPIPLALARELAAHAAGLDGHLWTMHRATAWRLVKRVMDDAGISGPMACCKGLRHGFGIFAADRNVPPNLIQRWMGHGSSHTTAIYLDAVGREERTFAARMWGPQGRAA
ncbi:MAG: tyrosine-type recombinase/integrase [Rubrivivax sp.]